MNTWCSHTLTQILSTTLNLVFQVPTVFDRQGAQLLAVAFLVVSRTWISDRIASLNGIRNIFFFFLSILKSERLFYCYLNASILRNDCEVCFGTG